MTNLETLKFSICVPVYKGSQLLKNSLDSVFRQKFQPYEIIIGDDNHPNEIDEIRKTQEIIKSYQNDKIKYFKNPKNLGCGGTFQELALRAEGDIIYLLAQDDILAFDALQRTHDAFLLDPDVGVVTRPYYWFHKDIHLPVRSVEPLVKGKDVVVSPYDSKQVFLKIYESVGQASGLAYRKKWLDIPFHHEIFPTHIYPFSGIIRKHKCVFLGDYMVAVGIEDSQTRHVSSIYDLSPTESWLKMYRTVFADKQYEQLRKWGEEHILTNHMGLVQLKNYAKPGVHWREMKIMARNYPKNFLSLKFWFFTIGTTLLPKNILSKLVDLYKSKWLIRSYDRVSRV